MAFQSAVAFAKRRKQVVMWVVYLLIAICVVSALVIFLLARNSPMGYEDRRGFHYGEPKKGQKAQ